MKNVGGGVKEDSALKKKRFMGDVVDCVSS